MRRSAIACLMLRALLLGGGAALVACGQGPAERRPGPLRAATTVPAAAQWLHALGGAWVETTPLLPPGASPHVWQPTVADMRALADADLCVAVGGGLEPWMAQFLVSTRTGRRDFVMVDWLLAEGLLHGAASPEQGDDHGHSHGDVDPHVWLDPRLAQALCRELTGLLCDLAPEHRGELLARSEDFQATLAALAAECDRRRAAWRGKRFIAFHPAWDHFADAVGLEVAAIIERTPGVEPSPWAMRALIDLARSGRADLLLAEPQFNDAPARRLAEVTGLPLVVLDPLGRADQSYEDFMRGLLRPLDEVLGAP